MSIFTDIDHLEWNLMRAKRFANEHREFLFNVHHVSVNPRLNLEIFIHFTPLAVVKGYFGEEDWAIKHTWVGPINQKLEYHSKVIDGITITVPVSTVNATVATAA